MINKIKKNWWLLLVVLYLILPLDIIPDVILPFGLADDLLLVILSAIKAHRANKKDAKDKIIDGEIVNEK